MKMICKEKDGNANEERRQAEELNREFYVIDPEEFADKDNNEYTPEDPEPEALMSKVIAFLAEKSADRFDYMADGMEMCECLITVDILRRAKVNVITASVMGRKEVRSSHQVIIYADVLAEEVDFDKPSFGRNPIWSDYGEDMDFDQ